MVMLNFSTGYFCPNRTITNDQFPCPPGTFSDRTDLTTADECDACPEGYFCSWGTGKHPILVVMWCGFNCPISSQFKSPSSDCYNLPHPTQA